MKINFVCEPTTILILTVQKFPEIFVEKIIVKENPQ